MTKAQLVYKNGFYTTKCGDLTVNTHDSWVQVGTKAPSYARVYGRTATNIPLTLARYGETEYPLFCVFAVAYDKNEAVVLVSDGFGALGALPSLLGNSLRDDLDIQVMCNKSIAERFFDSVVGSAQELQSIADLSDAVQGSLLRDYAKTRILEIIEAERRSLRGSIRWQVAFCDPNDPEWRQHFNERGFKVLNVNVG